jgi:hypothetical protein
MDVCALIGLGKACFVAKKTHKITLQNYPVRLVR